MELPSDAITQLDGIAGACASETPTEVVAAYTTCVRAAYQVLFFNYIATKQIIAPALNTLVGGSSKC
jgi:hypothetical protein